MNYIYITCSKDRVSCLPNMLKSLDRYCNCTILANTFDVDDELFQGIVCGLSNPVIRYQMSDVDWLNKRAFAKVKRTLDMGFKYGDNVFAIDVDVIVQDDIFKAFEKDFDVCYTTRYYEHKFAVNGGVWGFKYNERSEQFLKFHIDEILNPTWEPYVRFRKKWQRASLDWWCGQGFLNEIHFHKLPFECKVLDLGSTYNYCPSPEIHRDAKEQLLKRFGNQQYKILHFKGPKLQAIMIGLEI